MIALAIGQVSKRYGEQQVLDTVDLELEHERCIALTGRSGSGKTTLLNIIAGLEPADSGTIHIDGELLANSDSDQRAALRREKMGIVFQSHNLIPSLTVSENLLFPLALNGRRDNGSVAAWLERLDLSHTADRLPDSLSGGESQRVAVARALIHKPALVLADEPTASLDEDNAAIVMNELLEHSRNQGAALLLVTHSSDLSARMDGRICLERGHLVHIADSARA